MTIKDLVKGRTAKFNRYRNGQFFYTIDTEEGVHEFVVPQHEVAGATLPAEEKAIFFMRWLRKPTEQEAAEATK